MTTIFTQNDNFDNFEWNKSHFVHFLSLQQHLFSSQLEISHVLNGTTAEIQHRKWGPRSLDSRKEYLGRLWTWLSPSKSWISPSSPSTSLKVEGAQLGKGGTVVCICNHQTWKKAMQEFIIDWTSLKVEGTKKGKYCGVCMQPLNSNKRDWKGFQYHDVGI